LLWSLFAACVGINYVNERLQQIFIDLTLKHEQKEYHDEDMKWKDIQFFDNIVVVELIEGKNPPGVFRVLDDVCRTCHAVDSVTADVKFMEKLAKTQSHPHLIMYDKQFIIKHYAGDVTYTCDGDSSAFCFKNKDNLFLSIVVGMLTTTEGWIKDLFKDDRVDSKAGPPATSGADIRQSAQLLIDRLTVCFAHYIRCIKPNETRSALSFESSNVKHQVTYLGLLENVRVKKSGYSYRHYFKNFIERFGPLCNDQYRPQYDKQGVIIPNPNVNPNPLNINGGRESCMQIIRKVISTPPIVAEAFRISEEEFGLGRTKIFVKSPETIFTMAEMLEQKLDPEGYKQKQQDFKKVERLASKNKRKADRGLGTKCSIM
jgi:myosin-1